MGKALVILSQINPLDNVPADQVTSVEVVGENVYLNVIDYDGKRNRMWRKKSDFLMEQIQHYGFEIYS